MSALVFSSHSAKNMNTLYTSSTALPGSSGTVNWYVLYSPRFITMTPRVSSSSSRRAVRIGFVISRLLHPPVTKIQSLKRLSRTTKNVGSPCSFKTTGMAILYGFSECDSDMMHLRDAI